MVDKKWCLLEQVQGMTDPRQRLVRANVLLEQLATATKQARDVRDSTIAEMGSAGIGLHELTHLSGMSKSHVQATVRRGVPDQDRKGA